MPPVQLRITGTTLSIVGKDGTRYRADYRRCSPLCPKCPHGPYWCALYYENGKTKRMYLGATRHLPQAARDALAEIEGQL